MAKNLMARFLNWQDANPKKSNYAKDFRNVLTADVGYGTPIFCDEVLANTNVSLDMKCAMFTNATVSPLYSRIKMQVTAWWCPMSTYVPALRDSVKTDATTDYSFPTVNFDWTSLRTHYMSDVSAFGDSELIPVGTKQYQSSFATVVYGDNMPYVPTSSIFTYLRMWPANFSPLQFLAGTTFPEGRNAIPLLMYYDIFRNYIINNQENNSYLRMRAKYDKPDSYVLTNRSLAYPAGAPVDRVITREQLDTLYKRVRTLGMNYTQDEPWDITLSLGALFGGNLFPTKNVFFPVGPNGVNVADLSLGDMYENYYFQPDYHYGLWRDTYINDPYVAFISDENVDYERDVAKVVVSADETASGNEMIFTMEQLRVSSMIQNFVRSHIFRNNSFDEYVDVEYGCRPQRNLDKPMFLGALSSYLVFNDVMSTAQTGDSMDVMDKQQLGSRAAVGEGHMFSGKYRGKDRKGRYDRPFVKFHAPEPGYLMLILTIKPEVNYFEGYDQMYDKHTIFDLYRPSMRGIGYQDKCYRHINTIPQLEVDATGARVLYTTYVSRDGGTFLNLSTPRDWSAFDVAYAHEPFGFEYMSKPSVINGQMAEIGTYLHWTNARSLNNVFDTPVFRSNFPSDDRGVDLLNTTILPEMYHYIFANTNNLDNFQFFYDFDYNVYQPVARQILSFK